MILKHRLLVSAISLAVLGAAQPASAAPWVKGFVVSSYEYSFRYGGRAGFTREGEIEPGIDCRHGSTTHFADDIRTKHAVAQQKWRSQQEIDWIAAPPGLEKVRGPNLTRFYIWDRALSHRGYSKEIETYVNPFAAEDPGQPEVTGRIGDGFNLDGKIKDSDFVSTDGEQGIDHALYRAWGCDAPWRGNGNATLHLRANDKTHDGLYTVVIRVTGNKDPMNDDNAIVEIGYSPDKIVRDARANVATDYSYRILKTRMYTRLKATIRNGVLETEQVDRLHVPRIAWFYDQVGDANFSNGRIRLHIAADGQSATGLMGGYRNWRDLYAENTFAQDGGQQGIREHEDHVALYYALRRNADGMFNAKTNKFDGISSAYRLKMSSAYVVDAEKGMDVPKLLAEEDRKKAFEETRLAMIKGTETRVPQLVPPGTSEAAVGIMEWLVIDLPSKDFFLKTLYRQRYAGEDENGIPSWMPELQQRVKEELARKQAAKPAPPPKPQQEARESGSAARTP
ncbi:MAG: hypothetical protein RJB58_1432 [Pseudomonadota bacterium]